MFTRAYPLDWGSRIMARTIKVRYGIGDNVKHFTGVKGKVTAIYRRGRNTAYEFSYLRDGNEPASCNCEECELEGLVDGQAMVGFRKAGRG